MQTLVFGQRMKVVEGWYWLIPGRELRTERAVGVSVMGRDLVVYRTKSGGSVAMDAYCPHMGCHLSLGRVEGDCLRCFFHNWAFGPNGKCVAVPGMESPPNAVVRTWHVRERNDMIWLWAGKGEPTHAIPEPPELTGTEYDFSLGKAFAKKCHPNVVMINAIDEQHFRTVHHVPGHLMHMSPRCISGQQIEFRNTADFPMTNRLFRLASRFYSGPLRYELNYWYGSNGVVTMGPDFLHIYIMFALRQTAEGTTEGQTIVFTKKRSGIFGWALNRFLLFMTRIVGNYFSIGDTKVFQSIRFDYKTPVPADRAVQAFIRHLEKQPVTNWPDQADSSALKSGLPSQAASLPRPPHAAV